MLIELLVAITVIVILAALALGAAQSVIAKGRQITEINAAKNVLTACSSATTDLGSYYLSGFDRTVNSIPGPGGVWFSGWQCKH